MFGNCDTATNGEEFFYNSIKDTKEEIVVIVNKEKIVNIDVKPNHWHIKTLGVFDEINL